MLSGIRQILTRDTSWLELANATLLLVWAIVLLLPVDTFVTSQSYAAMRSWASEPVWATLASIVSGFALWGLNRRVSKPRYIGLLGGVFFWGTVGATIASSNVAATGGWVYLAFANLCALAYYFGTRR